MGRFRLLGVAVLAAALVVGGALPATAEQPDDPGATSVAAECKKGGWAELAPEDDASVPFRNQGECIGYVATGGSPVPTTGTPADPSPGHRKGCAAAGAKQSKGSAHASPHEKENASPNAKENASPNAKEKASPNAKEKASPNAKEKASPGKSSSAHGKACKPRKGKAHADG